MRATRRRPAMAAIAGSLALGATACGTTSERPNQPRPPAQIVVNAAIGTDRVSVSPSRFGAGPIELVVANLTDASQQITLETAGRSSRPGLRRQTTPIDPRDTATLKADVRSGRYVVHVAGDGIDAATLRVSGRRRSAQNDLLQP
jgi:hypothetical protein